MVDNPLKEKKGSRREAFKILGGLLASGAGAVTIVHYMVRRDPAADETVSLGPVTEFPTGEFQKRIVTITEHGTWQTGPVEKIIWLKRNPDDSFLVLSGTCPHMNCTINLQANQTFECPCHHSSYTSEGQVVLGPAPRPLDTLDYRVSDGILSVQYRNFRKGIPDKIPS